MGTRDAAPGFAWRPLLLVGLLALGACASSPPSSFYTLTPLSAAGRPPPIVEGPVSIGLGPVTFPSFLDRPQIVSRDRRNRLSVDELNRWGGTLQDDFVRVWGENLSYLLHTSRVVIFPTEVRYPLDFRISADVLSFEEGADGEAVLKVRWAILDPLLERAMSAHEGTYRHRVGAPGAPVPGKGEAPDRSALISALSAALGDFSQDVAAAVRALPKPPPKETPLY